VPNPTGNVEALVPAPEGNAYGLSHGFFSKRVISERAEAIADGLMLLPFAVPLDRLAAEEIASVIASLEAIDRALSDGRVETRGKVRGLLSAKVGLTRELRAWLSTFGATPAARAEWAAKLGQPSFKEAVEARIRAQREAEGEADATTSGSARNQRRGCRA
jgi:hypothetical protein